MIFMLINIGNGKDKVSIYRIDSRSDTQSNMHHTFSNILCSRVSVHSLV